MAEFWSQVISSEIWARSLELESALQRLRARPVHAVDRGCKSWEADSP